MNYETVENKALTVGVYINFIMAIAGWLAFYFSNSEALLLDGNFSFISAISTLIATTIAKIRHERTELFPFGKYGHESFFVFIKGMMLIGILIMSFVQNTIKIIDYINGKPIDPIETGIIVYYSIGMLILCFGLAFFYRQRNKVIENASSILSVESKSSMIDGVLSLGAGMTLFLVSLINVESKLHFLIYIGDAILVILLVLLMIKTPILIIKDSFIELAGGILQDRELKKQIEKVIEKHRTDAFAIHYKYIAKLGSSYLVVIYIKVEDKNVNIELINNMKEKIMDDLLSSLHTVQLEIVIR